MSKITQFSLLPFVYHGRNSINKENNSFAKELVYVDPHLVNDDKKEMTLEIIMNHLTDLSIFICSKAENEYNEFQGLINSNNEDILKFKQVLNIFQESFGQQKKLSKEKDNYINESLSKMAKLKTEIESISSELKNYNVNILTEEIQNNLNILKQKALKFKKENVMNVYNNLSSANDVYEISIVNAFVSLLAGTCIPSPPDVCEVFLRNYENLILLLDSFNGENIKQSLFQSFSKVIQENEDLLNSNIVKDKTFQEKYNYLLVYSEWTQQAIKLTQSQLHFKEVSEQKEILERNLKKKKAKLKFREDLLNDQKKEILYLFDKKEYDTIQINISDMINIKNLECNSLKNYINLFPKTYFGDFIDQIAKERIIVEKFYIDDSSLPSRSNDIYLASIQEFVRGNSGYCGYCSYLKS